MSITMLRWSPTLNECRKMLELFTQMPHETHIASNVLDSLMWETGGTSDVIVVME